MGSTNFTTHYSIPLPLGTDLTTPMDYNEAAETVDTALFGAVTDAGNASDAAAAAVSTANAASEAVDTVSADLVQEKAKIVALQTRMTNAENEIDDVRADGEDAICAYNEPTATSTHAYAIGEYFFYNNTLYQATADIAIGETITPDTNCETTNITSELIQINSDLSEVGLVVKSSNSSSTTISTHDTWVDTVSITLTAGKWLLMANAIANNSSSEIVYTITFDQLRNNARQTTRNDDNNKAYASANICTFISISTDNTYTLQLRVTGAGDPTFGEGHLLIQGIKLA